MNRTTILVFAVSLAALSAAGGDAKARVVAAADRVVAGDITIRNIRWQFKDGRIDWYFNPTKLKGPLNHEWMWQLNRMGFWQELGDAYRATHDEKYARAFAQQLESWLDQTGGIPNDKGYRPYAADTPWRTIEEGIRLAGSWPTAWDAFKDSPAFTSALKERFFASMRAQARHLLAHRTNHNWLLMEMGGVYQFATKFPAYPECEGYRREAVQVFSNAIREQVLPDGLHDELTPGYHGTVYGHAMPIYEMAKKGGFTDELPADFLDVLRRAAEGPVAMMTPAFTPPRFNDSCTAIRTASTMHGASRLFPERRDFLWAESGGRQGEPPAGAVASRFLPWGGFAVMRSGWDAEATYLCFDIGPLGTNHSHQDKLSFVLWKGREEMVYDDGGGQYEHSSMRAFAVSGYDHSTLLVDGLAQNRREPGRVTAPIDAGWASTPARDRAFGVYDQGYGPKMDRLATQRREIVFDKKADVFTVTDDIASADGNPHDYALQFQLKTTNAVVSADGRLLTARFSRYDLEIAAVEGGTITTACAQREPRLAGWYVHARGADPATTVFITATACRDRRFITTLKPRKK